MGDRWHVSRRQFLRTLAATGALTAADLAWLEEPFGWPRKAHAASPVRFQFSVPEPLRITVVESMVERFNKSQSEFEVKVEFVPQAQARQKLITGISAGYPPDCCQIWDYWVGELAAMGGLEDLTGRVKAWKHYASTVPTAWETVTWKGRFFALPHGVGNDVVFLRTDRLKEYGLKMPREDWTWEEFLALAKAFTKVDRNQYGFGLRGSGQSAMLYATEFMYGNGAQVLKDGKVVVNSPQAVQALDWYLDLFRKHHVVPPSAPTDSFRQIVEAFGRGITSMVMHNSGSVEEQKKAVGESNFTTVPIPVGPAKKRVTFYFCETLTMFQGAKNKEGAWRFMTWMLEDDQHYNYCKLLGMIPTRQSLAERPYFTQGPYAGFVKSFPFTIVSPYLDYPAWGGKIESEGIPLLQEAMVGKLSARECLDKFAEVLKKSMV